MGQVDGVDVYFAGGGAGGSQVFGYSSAVGGKGGGGAGQGAAAGSHNGTPGTINSGGGGGGGGGNAGGALGGLGGKGVVIFSIINSSFPISVISSSGLTYTTADNGRKIIFTSGTGTFVYKIPE